jgi:membrane-bound lytic murein transglycosylase B
MMRKTHFATFLIFTAALGACGSNPSKSPAETAAKATETRAEVTAGHGAGLRTAVARPTGFGTGAVDGGRPAGAYQAKRVSGDYAGYSAVARFIERMAREEGFDPGYLAGVLSRVERQQWILDFVTRPRYRGPAVPTGAWNRYRAKFLTSDNITGGARFWRHYEGELQRAYAQYGVPPEYVVAILGVETRYGGYVGKHRVLDALATLAFDFPRRSEFFTDELAAFLVMARDEDMDPFHPVGSYAGAMGLGQFMPSSFHRWAVDFDGNGRRDLWNPVDAIGSVANYFASHGWRTGQPVVVRARAEGSAARAMKTGFDTSYSLAALDRHGVRPQGGIAGEDEVSLIGLDVGSGYEYWLGLSNFYVITRYNHSSYYAMAVHQLAQAVRARHGPAADTRLTQGDLGDGPPIL